MLLGVWLHACTYRPQGVRVRSVMLAATGSVMASIATAKTTTNAIHHKGTSVQVQGGKVSGLGCRQQATSLLVQASSE